MRRRETATGERVERGTRTSGSASLRALGSGRRDRLVFGTYLSPLALCVYRAVAATVSRRLGCEVRLRVGRSFDAFADGTFDVGFVCGLPYVRLADGPSPVHAIAAPVLTGGRYGGRPVYYSDVVVREDDPARGIADLAGRVWSYNDPDSHSGYLVLLHELATMGADRGFFGRFVEAGFHHESVRRILAGEVDAAAIDTHVLELLCLRRPELARGWRVVGTLGPSTIQPLVVADHVPPDVREAIRRAVCDVHLDPESTEGLARGLVDRFVPVGSEDYDDIRGMLRTVEAAGLLGTDDHPGRARRLASRTTFRSGRSR